MLHCRCLSCSESNSMILFIHNFFSFNSYNITVNSEAVVRRCSIIKGVNKNFTIFTGKHLCQSLFFNKDAELSLQLF